MPRTRSAGFQGRLRSVHRSVARRGWLNNSARGRAINSESFEAARRINAYEWAVCCRRRASYDQETLKQSPGGAESSCGVSALAKSGAKGKLRRISRASESIDESIAKARLHCQGRNSIARADPSPTRCHSGLSRLARGDENSLCVRRRNPERDRHARQRRNEALRSGIRCRGYRGKFGQGRSAEDWGLGRGFALESGPDSVQSSQTSNELTEEILAPGGKGTGAIKNEAGLKAA